MRFRLTIILLISNIALFIAIWILQTDKIENIKKDSTSVPFTQLEVHGKNLDKPRILKLENNKWKIVSPMDWPANLFAVNRIRNQLEFIDQQTSFSLEEVKQHGNSLADYGLDDPIFTFKFGNGEKMYTLKVGKNAPIGERMYMLDDDNNKIIVVDKEFVDSLVKDIESLRNQLVFDIQRFEVSAFSLRLPSDANNPTNTKLKRIGLVKDQGKWKFETPIEAMADPREIDNFLNYICQISAKSFTITPEADTGFDIGSLPTAITLQGTNQRQVLLLGNTVDDQVYAKLEDNPTIFTLDSAILKDLDNIQTKLREKSFVKIDTNNIVSIDISKGKEDIKLRKLKNAMWELLTNDDKDGNSNADLAVVNDILNRFDKVMAIDFVSDAPGENLSEYGIDENSLKVVLKDAQQNGTTLLIGKPYKLGAVNLLYATTQKKDAVYGITGELMYALKDLDKANFKSKILESIPQKAQIKNLTLKNLNKDEESINLLTADFSSKSQIAAAKIMLSSAKKFIVKNYIDASFDEKSITVGKNKYDFAYEIQADIELLGTGDAVDVQTKKWYFTKRLSGTVQYGLYQTTTFELTQELINALFELTQENNIQ